jgi:ABC-type dipeptide/oligopeptide/nickel transport system permease subunit
MGRRAMTVAVFAFSMFGEALGDLLDPRLKGGGWHPK